MIFNQLQEFGSLIDAKTDTQTEVKQLKFRYLGLYFTADWCGACVKLVRFLPKLMDYVNQQEQHLKLITFRMDDSQSDFGYKYYKFKNAHLTQTNRFADMLSIQFLPSILIYNLQGRLISSSGVRDMQIHKQKTIEYWDSL